MGAPADRAWREAVNWKERFRNGLHGNGRRMFRRAWVFLFVRRAGSLGGATTNYGQGPSGIRIIMRLRALRRANVLWPCGRGVGALWEAALSHRQCLPSSRALAFVAACGAALESYRDRGAWSHCAFSFPRMLEASFLLQYCCSLWAAPLHTTTTIVLSIIR